VNTDTDDTTLSKLSLRVLGDPLDPDFLTQLLGHIPSKGRKKGDQWVVAKTGEIHEARDGCWIFNAPDSATGDLDWQIEWIFAKLTDNLASWKRTSEAHEVDIFVRLAPSDPSYGLSLSAETLDEMSLRGIKLILDVKAQG